MALGVGLIGSGFMGKCHALALGAVGRVFGDVAAPRLELICDAPRERAEAMAGQFGFARATDDWRALVADPAVDLVSITTPNRLHREMALAAIAAGKHVWCEKPLALTLGEAEEMAAAAEAAGVTTMVGYNYLRNPAFAHAERLVEAGAIGRVVHFRGVVDEDYQADPELAWTWRATVAEAGLGTLGDLGCHLVSIACALMGPVESLVAEMATVHATRPLADGSGRAAVENEDVASALVRFAGGVTGVLIELALGLGAEEPARVGGARRAGDDRLRAGADERAQALRQRGAGRSPRVPHHPDRAGAPALRRLRAGSRAPARVQRPEGDRGGGAAAGDRGGGAGRIRTSATRWGSSG